MIGQTDVQGQGDVHVCMCVCVSLSPRHTLLADHVGILIVGIVGVAQLAGRLHLKLHEFVPKFACVPHAVYVWEVCVCVCVCVCKYQLGGWELEGGGRRSNTY